jgi:hypothetical protein
MRGYHDSDFKRNTKTGGYEQVLEPEKRGAESRRPGAQGPVDLELQAENGDQARTPCQGAGARPILGCGYSTQKTFSHLTVKALTTAEAFKLFRPRPTIRDTFYITSQYKYTHTHTHTHKCTYIHTCMYT